MIEWKSNSSQVFFNPRIEAEEKRRVAKQLLKKFSLAGHLWFATSGTSGKRKFAALSKAAFLASAASVNRHLSVRPSDIWVNALPYFHVGGAAIFARGYLSGSQVVNIYSEKRRWDPRFFQEALKQASATLTALVPAQLYDLVKNQCRAPDAVRAVIIGGGGLSPSLWQQAAALGWRVLPSYGLTECASQVATANSYDNPALHILDHVRVKVDDKGVIFLNGPSLLSCYALFEKGEATLHNPKRAGWLRTEDVGRLNGGILEIAGRTSDLIKVGGESVNLQALQQLFEEVKAACCFYHDCSLFAEDDERLGKQVALAVGDAHRKDLMALLEKFQAAVLPFERIRNVYILQEPVVNSMGKPLKRFSEQTLAQAKKLSV